MLGDRYFIGSNIRGTQDLLSDGCGLLVELGNTDGLAKAMIQVVENPQSLAAMAQKAKVKMQDCDLKQIIKQYEDIYSLALSA